MIRLSASADYGQTGQYVARITGRDTKFTFRREFIGSRGGKRNDYSCADIDDPGLYETRDATRKGKVDRYRVVVPHGDDGALVAVAVAKADAMTIARGLHDGRAIGDIVAVSTGDDGTLAYEIRSAAAAAKAAAAATVEAAIEACWSTIAGLSERDRRAVLAALRARSKPAAAAAEET